MTSQVGWLPFLGCKTGQRTGEDLHLKGAEEEFEEIAKGHIFKVLGPCLDLVEQREATGEL